MGKRLWLLVGAVIIASAIMVTGATATSTGVSSSAQKTTLVYGAEQDVNGFNTALDCCNQFWAVVIAGSPVIRGAWIINSRLQYVPDVITGATLKPKPFTITYNIRKNAKWSDGKPVTAADFIYVWRQILDPKNEVTSRDGYDQIIRATPSAKGKRVSFVYKKPYAGWKDLFNGIYPAHVLGGEDFNKIWADCVCNPKNGRPIGNGPFLLQSYRKGTDATLIRNPRGWHGPRPKLSRIVFRFIQDTNTEIQAMRGGEVDAIFPSPQTALTALQRQSGIRYQSGPGLYLEHIDLSGKGKHNPLMEKVWFRQAIITGINRGGLIRTFFGDIAPTLKVLNSLVFYPPDANYKPHFSRYAFNTSKARQLLTRNGCRAGGDGIMVCGGVRAQIVHTTTSTNRRRVLAAQIYKENLKAIGIDMEYRGVPPNVLFGDGPESISSGNFDMAEYAWVTSPDPSGFVPWLKCGGESNHMTYCNRAVTRFLNQSDVTLNAKKRAALFNKANALMAQDVPSIPLYAVPVIQVSKNAVKGLGAPNPTSFGPTWNAHLWKF